MPNVAITSFSGGEIGKEALARVELEMYPTTAEIMENFWPSMRGSMSKVTGTQYLGTLTATAAIVRPFVFNTNQTRAMEFSDNEIRFVDDDAYVALSGGAATVGTPVDNTSTGGSSVSVAGVNVTFTATAGGEAKATVPITSGVTSQTTFRFEIERRRVHLSPRLSHTRP